MPEYGTKAYYDSWPSYSYTNLWREYVYDDYLTTQDFIEFMERAWDDS